MVLFAQITLFTDNFTSLIWDSVMIKLPVFYKIQKLNSETGLGARGIYSVMFSHVRHCCVDLS